MSVHFLTLPTAPAIGDLTETVTVVYLDNETGEVIVRHGSEREVSSMQLDYAEQDGLITILTTVYGQADSGTGEAIGWRRQGSR